MAEWIDFDRWPDCVEMERPGIVFEVSNEEDRRLFTRCAVPLDVPFDWNSPPVRFRIVPAPLPRHSDPIPEPQEPRWRSLEMIRSACSTRNFRGSD